MITVKNLVPLLKNGTEIYIVWEGKTRQLDPKDTLDMDIYGDYVVERLTNHFTQESYELWLLYHPVKYTEDRYEQK